MVERRTKALAYLAVLAAVAAILGAVLAFLQTREVATALLLGAGLPFVFATVAVLAWVAEDARSRELPTVPWMVAIVMAPGVGFVGYLLARQLADREAHEPV